MTDADSMTSKFEHRIMTTRKIHEIWRDSHVSEISERITYLVDLLTKYFPTLDDIFESCDELAVVAYTSEAAPLTTEEEMSLKDVIASSNKMSPIETTFIKGIDYEAKEDISLQIIALSSKIINDDEDE